MPLQTTQPVELGQIFVSNNRALVLTIPNIGSSMAVVFFEQATRLGGIAHIVLPESSLANVGPNENVGKYADLAIPMLLEQFLEKGGNKQNITVRMVGGAQMFNFGGGAGNLLNIGSRNAVAIRAALSRVGLSVEKADIGGNKGKNLRFVLATGQIFINQIGDKEYQL